VKGRRPACIRTAIGSKKENRWHLQFGQRWVVQYNFYGHMDQVFQALIDCSSVLLDLKTVKTILGYMRRPKYRKRKKKSAEWEVAVEETCVSTCLRHLEA
jgi:hypothetical protein